MKKVFSGIFLALILIMTSSPTHAATTQIKIDGVTITSDVNPESKNNRTMVPLRVISESLGAKVSWSDSQVTLTKNDMKVILKLNSNTVVKNGKTELLDVKPYMKNNLTFVPIRFIAETFGNNFNYKNGTVTIDTKPLVIDGIEVKALQYTMMEALRLGYEEAKKYTEEEPLLINLTSTDDTTSSQGKNEGADGKRSAWNLLFGSKKGNIHINLSINDGKVDAWVSKDDNNLLQKGQYAVSDIKIDSPEAIKKAIEVLDIQPEDPKVEDDWIKGYHFSISGFLTDPNSSEQRYLLRIMGISPNSPNSENDSLRMTVFFDVKTGEMMNASEMTGYDKDDRTDWKDVEFKEMPGNK